VPDEGCVLKVESYSWLRDSRVTALALSGSRATAAPSLNADSAVRVGRALSRPFKDLGG
jgi:hypothetical protein